MAPATVNNHLAHLPALFTWTAAHAPAGLLPHGDPTNGVDPLPLPAPGGRALARNLDDLRRLVRELTGRGVAVQFVKEQLTFTAEDSPMATLLLSVLGAFAEFERALIRERQLEGIALAKARGAYKGRKPSLSAGQAEALRARAAAGEPKAGLAREFGISRQTLYQYLSPPVPASS
jgi:DNA invertase Pin-like site-specific DNA recombinase